MDELEEYLEVSEPEPEPAVEEGPGEPTVEEPGESIPEPEPPVPELLQRTEQAEALRHRMDALAASRGFRSFDELEAAVESERRAQERQAYIDRHGVDPDALAPLVRQAVEQNPAVMQARRMAEQQNREQVERFKTDQLAELEKAFPDSGIQAFSDLENLPNAQEVLGLWAKGIPLAKAYAAANIDTIRERQTAAAKQAAINAYQGKGHLTPAGGDAGGAAEVPAEVAEEFRVWNPGATDAEIRRFYAKHQE